MVAKRQTLITRSAGANTNAALIWFPMCCHSVACGMASQTQSAIQSTTGNSTADHIMPSFAFTIRQRSAGVRLAEGLMSARVATQLLARSEEKIGFSAKPR